MDADPDFARVIIETASESDNPVVCDAFDRLRAAVMAHGEEVEQRLADERRRRRLKEDYLATVFSGFKKP